MPITNGAIVAYGIVVTVAAALVIACIATLIPLDTVQAVTGVSIILGVSYAIAFVLWAVVIIYYSYNDDPMALTWMNTHMLFLVLLPGIIGSTAMNVVTVQNTRNLIAGKITST